MAVYKRALRTEAEVRHASLYRLVGRSVKRERLRKNFTQFGLAVRVGVTRTTITNLERGRQRVPIHVLDDIAAVLDCRLVSLLSRPEKP